MSLSTEDTRADQHSAADRADFEAFIADSLRGRTCPEREEIERYLRTNPGFDVRDYKEKSDLGLVEAEPSDMPWHRLRSSEVRALATRVLARRLRPNVRQAAARDPSLVWNGLARRYRLRVAGDPPFSPPPADASSAPLTGEAIGRAGA